MNYTIYPRPLSGVINAPSSKSIMHRVLICASFSHGNTIIENPLYCYDTLMTMKALENIGVTFKKDDNKLIVYPPKQYKLHTDYIECGNSASTIRFLMPLYTKLFNSVVFKGDERLMKRIETEDLTEMPFEYYIQNNTITVSNIRTINNITIHNHNTSQLISGLLLYISIISKKNSIHLVTNNNELDPYIELTLDVLAHFGVVSEITHQDNLFTISINKHLTSIEDSFGRPTLKSCHYYIEGDYSSASNMLALGLLGDNVIVKNLFKTSKQGDKAFIKILESMNAEFQIGIDAVRAIKSNLTKTEIDLTYNPDLGPLLMGIASVSKGTTSIINYERLTLKESNRLTETINILKSLGANIEIKDDTILIHGKPMLEGGVTVDPINDHRLVMMIVALTNKYQERVTILNAECVNKSYPTFWEDYRKLKGVAVVSSTDEIMRGNNE